MAASEVGAASPREPFESAVRVLHKAPVVLASPDAGRLGSSRRIELLFSWRPAGGRCDADSFKQSPKAPF